MIRGLTRDSNRGRLGFARETSEASGSARSTDSLVAGVCCLLWYRGKAIDDKLSAGNDNGSKLT